MSSEATGCCTSVRDHRNPGEYPVRLPGAAGFLQSRAAHVRKVEEALKTDGEQQEVLHAATQKPKTGRWKLGRMAGKEHHSAVVGGRNTQFFISNLGPSPQAPFSLEAGDATDNQGKEKKVKRL